MKLLKQYYEKVICKGMEKPITFESLSDNYKKLMLKTVGFAVFKVSKAGELLTSAFKKKGCIK